MPYVNIKFSNLIIQAVALAVSFFILLNNDLTLCISCGAPVTIHEKFTGVMLGIMDLMVAWLFSNMDFKQGI